MRDRSSRPLSSQNRLPTRLERRIIALQFTRRLGPHRIAFHLCLARSTVERALARFRMPLLRDTDQATGLPVRRPAPVRHEKPRPGELVHVYITKQGRIPDGGWRFHGRGFAQDRAARVLRDRAARRGARGFRFLHHAIDDHSRLAYSEIHDDERNCTGAALQNRRTRSSPTPVSALRR